MTRDDHVKKILDFLCEELGIRPGSPCYRPLESILFVLLDGPARFSEVKQLVPDLSDRLLSERMKELEAEGIVERRVIDDMPVRVEYALTAKGRALEPAVRALKLWARAWL